MTNFYLFVKLLYTLYLQSSLVLAQGSTSIYVDSTSSTNTPPFGSLSSPYNSLLNAWNDLTLIPTSNVTIYLANGLYQLPQLRSNGSMSITITPKDITNPSVYISPPNTESNVQVSAKSSFVFQNIHFVSTQQSPPVAAFTADGTSSLSLLNCILSSGKNSTSAFQFASSGNATMTFQSLKADSVFLELSTSNFATLALDTSLFTEAKGSSRGLIVALDSSSITVKRTSFVMPTGNIIGLQQQATILWDANHVSQVICDQNQFGFAMIQHQSQLQIKDSQVSDISAAQCITCSGGLMGLYNSALINIRNSTFQNLFGRLVYAEGNSVMTVNSNSVFSNLYEVEQAGLGGAQYLGSIRGSAQVKVSDSQLTTLTGSWIVLENGYLAMDKVTLVDNFCPASKSFWVSIAGSGSLFLNEIAFKSSLTFDQQSISHFKTCTIVTASEQASVNIFNSWISNYKCRSSCLISRGQALVALNHTNFSHLFSSDSSLSLISLTNQIQHSISRLNCSYNSGNSPSVLGFLGLATNPVSIQISDSVFDSNQIPSLSVGQGSNIDIQRSNFTNNVGQAGAGPGSPLINQGALNVTSCLFSDNVGSKLGGAIYHSGNALSIIDTDFIRNRANMDGGGLYLNSRANLTHLNFVGNIARRGGGWFSLDYVAKTHVTNAISYSSNQPNNYAGTLHRLQLAERDASAQLIARPGSTLNTTIEVSALDAFDQLYQFGGLDSVILIKAHAESSSPTQDDASTVISPPELRFIGETTQALVRGVVYFRGIQVYGAEPPQSTLPFLFKVSRLQSNGSPDPRMSVNVPLTLQGCTPDTMIEQSSTWGPEYLACTPQGCPQGCANGACVSAGNCVCQPGWEGLACDQATDNVDSIVWQLDPTAFPYASVGVRNALGLQIRALAEHIHVQQLKIFLDASEIHQYTAQIREFRKLPESQSIQVRFIVVDVNTTEIVQANQLSDINAQLLDLMLQPDSPVVRSGTQPFGYTWPPTMGVKNALVNTFINQVPKQTISVRDPIGAALVMVHLLGLAGSLALWIFLVILPSKKTAIVRSSTQFWLSWYTLGAILLHLWMIVSAMPPSDYACQMQFGFSAIGIATMVGASLFKTVHLYLTYNNPIMTKLNDGSSNNSGEDAEIIQDTGLGWCASGLIIPSLIWVGIESVLLLGWLIPSSMRLTAKVSWSPSVGSYWHCTTPDQLVSPGAYVFYVVHVGMTLATVWLLRRMKRGVSLSQEPKVVLFVTMNMVVSISIIGAVQTAVDSFGVVIQYLIMSFALGMCLYVSSMGVLGYKVYLIMHAKNKSKIHVGVPKKPARVDDEDGALCLLHQSNVLASALAPVRVIKNHKSSFWNHWPSPWRVAFIEIAKEYRYLTIVLDNQPARFFSLPCYARIDRASMVITLLFKSGTRLEIQTRSLDNLNDWELVLTHVNTLLKHAQL